MQRRRRHVVRKHDDHHDNDYDDYHIDLGNTHRDNSNVNAPI
ncbi:MAG: hypothetical protein OXC99_04770 [Chloroflexi bacterium]|nr:hypothetical protein [Chloroflexota bacterium]